MPVYSKQILSGSTNGRPVQIIGTSSPGTTIHTVGPTATTDFDILWVYGWNRATDAREVTLEMGATATDAADRMVVSLNAQEGPNLIVAGWPFFATGSIIRAFATASDVLYFSGYANRVTTT